MKLADFVLPTKDVTLTSNGTLAVRGLSFRDLMAIYREHGVVLGAIFSEFVAQGSSLQEATVARALSVLATSAPEAVAMAIALAVDEPDEVDKVAKLPMLDQANLLAAVFEETLRSEADVKKLVEVAVRGLEAVNGLAVKAISGSR